jgi:uncharacterized phiE125 gp8 family phage protein
MWTERVVSGPALTPSGNFNSGQATVTSLSSTVGILVGSLVLNSGFIQPDTLVASVDSATQITLTQPATASGTAVTFTIHQEPITLAQAKAHARVEFPDDDPMIASFIISARKVVETMLGQRLITTTVDYFADNWPWLGGYYNRVIRAQAIMGPVPYWLPNSNTGIVDLHAAPLLSIIWVKYTDSSGTVQTIPSNQYIYDAIQPGSSIVGPSRIQPAFGFTWPIPRPTIDSINIRGTFGYGADYTAVPENIKNAIKMLVSYWYENREHVVVGTISTKLADTIEALISPSAHGSYS